MAVAERAQNLKTFHFSGKGVAKKEQGCNKSAKGWAKW
jgi:hypothetical protein